MCERCERCGLRILQDDDAPPSYTSFGGGFGGAAVPGVGGLGGGGNGGRARRRPSPEQMIMNCFDFKGIDPHVVQGMVSDVYALARERSGTGRAKISNVTTIAYIVDTKYAGWKGIQALQNYLYDELTIPAIKILCKRYVSEGKKVSDEFARNQEKQWNVEASAQPGYASKLDKLKRTRKEIFESLSEYVILKYDKSDVDWYRKEYAKDKENDVFFWKEKFFNYLDAVKLFGKKKDFRAYVKKYKV